MSVVPGAWVEPGGHDLTGEVLGVQQLVHARAAEADSWRQEVMEGDCAVLVLVDQAVDLRRGLVAALEAARGLGKDVTHSRTVGGGAEERLTAAVLVAALDAAGHAVAPVAAGLCRQDGLVQVAQMSAAMTCRFLDSAVRAVDELAAAAVGPGRRPPRLSVVTPPPRSPARAVTETWMPGGARAGWCRER